MHDYTHPPPTHSLAWVSLIASITGLTIFPTIGSIVGLIAGYAARKEILANPEQFSGDGMATAGIVIGWLGFAVYAIGICVALFVFGSFFGGITGLVLFEGM